VKELEKFDPMGRSKEECYQRGLVLAHRLLEVNGISRPAFFRYSDKMEAEYS
jgi:hypothetical protein